MTVVVAEHPEELSLPSINILYTLISITAWWNHNCICCRLHCVSYASKKGEKKHHFYLKSLLYSQVKKPPVQFTAIYTICLRWKYPGWNRKWKRKDTWGHWISLPISNKLHNKLRDKIRRGSQWVEAWCMLHIRHHALEWDEFKSDILHMICLIKLMAYMHQKSFM